MTAAFHRLLLSKLDCQRAVVPSFPLRLRQIDAVFAKFGRALGETASALRSFFRPCRWVDHLFDRLCGELLSAQPPAGLADGPRWRLDLEAQRHQAADGVRPGNRFVG
jgi:hypothetical protein